MRLSRKNLFAMAVIHPVLLSAASVTWTGEAGDGLWGSGANWSTGTVPVAEDVVFGASVPATITIANGVTASQGAVTFGADTPALTFIVAGEANFFSINGPITDNAAVAPTIVNMGGSEILYQGGQTTFNDTSTGNLNIVNQGAPIGFGGSTLFRNSADAGTSVITLLNDETNPNYWGYATVRFLESSSAASSVINNQGGAISFENSSTAGNATINNTGGTLYFYGDSTAGNATIVNDSGGLQFNDNSTAGAATIMNGARFADASDAGTATIHGGADFSGTSTGATATVIMSGSQVNISNHDAGSVAIGSLSGTGDIYIGANTLVVGGLNTDDTLAAYISDFGEGGGLTKTGTGTLTIVGDVFGDNDYSGQTTIDAGGALKIGDGGTTGSISSTSKVVNNGTLIFDRSNAVTFSKVISGAGALVQAGGGTLTLSGANTYEGGTTVENGFISFKNLGVFGAGNITLDGGGLAWGASTTVDVSGRLNAIGPGGATFNTGSNDVTFATGLSGGVITKLGSGKLTLNAANTHAGTIVSAGTLALGDAAALSGPPRSTAARSIWAGSPSTPASSSPAARSPTARPTPPRSTRAPARSRRRSAAPAASRNPAPARSPFRPRATPSPAI